jgi:hypothetical protein
MSVTGQRIRLEREARGLSLRAAAEEIGISFNTLLRIERGNDCRDSNARAVRRWLDDEPRGEQARTIYDRGWHDGYMAAIDAAQNAVLSLRVAAISRTEPR